MGKRVSYPCGAIRPARYGSRGRFQPSLSRGLFQQANGLFCLLSPFLFLCSTLLWGLLSGGCEKSATPVPPVLLSLTSKYVGVSESELRLEGVGTERADTCRLRRDGEEVLAGKWTGEPFFFYDSTLSPARSYRYQAFLTRGGDISAFSNTVTVTTLDTTSHEFQWEIFEIPSPYGSSVLYDVAIIDENNIWAVGEIHANGGPYNAVHWNGQQWELKRIQVFYHGSYIAPILEGIFLFSENDIWVTSGAPKHWSGNTWTQYHLWDMGVLGPEDGGVTKIWGSSPDDIYFVGRKGTIVHYDGQSWQKIESGTDLDIQDIWGSFDPKTGEPYILCTAAEKFSGKHSKIFRINPDNSVSELPWPFADRDSYSVWFKNSYHIFICGDGVIRVNRNNIYHIYDTLPQFYTNRIRGNEINDIYVAGAFGLLAHFNGVRWWTHPGFISGTFKSLAVKEHLAVAVGEKNLNAYITKLNRN